MGKTEFFDEEAKLLLEALEKNDGDMLAELGVEELEEIYHVVKRGRDCVILPAEIGQLTNLRELDLSFTAISSLPAEIGKLTNLRELDLSNTAISSLPAEIRFITNLRELSFGRTNIHRIPSWIAQLTSLKILKIDGLCLKEIPREVFALNLPFYHSFEAYVEAYRAREKKNNHRDFYESRQGILLEGTVLATQPISLFALDRKFIQAYYDEPKIPIREGKVIFLGDGGAGKSHTIERILKGGEDRGIHTDQTPGINIKCWEAPCGEKKVKINFWDFGGQEILHAMHRCFLTGRSLYVVVLRERSESRHNDLTLQARYWLENIRSFAPDCPVILAVNREQNIYGSSGINSRQLQEEFEGIVREPIVYCAREDRDDHFQELTDAIFKEALKLDSTEMEFPVSWNKVRSELETMSNRRDRTGSRYYIDKSDYKKLCLEQGIIDENIQRWLLEWFNDLGVCFSYHQEEGKELDRYQVLNPEWLTNAIYKVILIGKRPELSDNGVITRSEIDTILGDRSLHLEEWLEGTQTTIPSSTATPHTENQVGRMQTAITSATKPLHMEKQAGRMQTVITSAPESLDPKERTGQSLLIYNREEQGYVLDIMKKFNLCAAIDDRNYFIPALCPVETPEHFRPKKSEYRDHVRFEFRYSFLPDSVLHRLMIECIKSGFNRKASYFSGIRIDFETDEIILTAESDVVKNILGVDLYHKDEPALSRKKLSWVRRKVAEINSSMNLKQDSEVIVVCDGGLQADLKLGTLFKLRERGIKNHLLGARDCDELVNCDLDATLSLLYDKKVINRADRLMKSHAKPEIASFREALARAEAVSEEEEERMKDMKNKMFTLGFSFAGEQRAFVERMCEALCETGVFDKSGIFYDNWHDHLFNGANADFDLDKIYSKQCERVVVLFSEAYLEKHWTKKLEWTRAITARITEDPENVCLLRYGDVDIDSIPLLHARKDIVKDVSKMSPEEAAGFVVKWAGRPVL